MFAESVGRSIRSMKYAPWLPQVDLLPRHVLRAYLDRLSSLELSKWENGNLTTNLAETKDTGGAFLFMEATLDPGTEPPPHVHSREHELFYVLEGEFDVYVGKDAFKGPGDCIFLPKFTPHAFVIRSRRLRVLALFTPSGLEDASAG
jgi:quercetin dioxygenase-like cupin family protein